MRTGLHSKDHTNSTPALFDCLWTHVASFEKLPKEAAICMAWYPTAELVSEEDDRKRKKNSLQAWWGNQQRTLGDLHGTSVKEHLHVCTQSFELTDGSMSL